MKSALLALVPADDRYQPDRDGSSLAEVLGGLNRIASSSGAYVVPAVYEHHGIRFLYPENWSLMDEECDGWPHSVTVQSPQTAFWSLHVFPANQELRPLVKEVVDSIQASFPDQELEVLPATEEVADTETKGVDVCFFYLDLLVEARIRTLKTPSATLIWHYQAESRELEEMEQVFRAISTSLLQNHVPVTQDRF